MNETDRRNENDLNEVRSKCVQCLGTGWHPKSDQSMKPRPKCPACGGLGAIFYDIRD